MIGNINFINRLLPGTLLTLTSLLTTGCWQSANIPGCDADPAIQKT